MIDAQTAIRIVGAFAAIGCMLYVFAVFSARGMRSNARLGADRLVRIVESTPLSPTGSLHVVKIGERYHVIALAPSGVSLLTEIDPTLVERHMALRGTGSQRLWRRWFAGGAPSETATTTSKNAR